MPTTTCYQADLELEDGRLFSLQFYCKVWPATRWEPEDVDCGDYTYYLDGEEIAGSALPAEITESILDSMETRAIAIPEDYAGYPDEDY